MKKFIIVLIFTVSLIIPKAYTQETGTFTDSRDGKTYKTVKLGDQTWMAENLKFWVDKKSPDYKGSSYFYKGENENYRLYGRLYDWKVACESCPEGWHLPSVDEWKTMIISFGDFYDENGQIPANKQLSKEERKRRKELFKEISKALAKGGSSGFDIDYGGYRDKNVYQGVNLSTMRSFYSGLGTVAKVWTADAKINKGAINAQVFHFQKTGKNSGAFAFGKWRKGINCSVRCVQDK
ncbi:MAG: hypothetical protein HQ521_16810 [Bacteroidetes bacterium]|nr:hypothetical protein [Bacteroidota bacterium]